MSNLKKLSIAILIAIVLIIIYIVFSLVDVEDETYKQDKQATSQVVQSQ